MKNKLYYAFILFITLGSCNADSSSHLKEYNEKGMLAKGAFLNDTIKIGEHIAFYKNGEIQSKATYDSSGRINGEALLFYKNGQLWQKRHFVHGNLNGRYVEYYENGNLNLKGFHFMNNFVGNIYHYDTSGKLLAYNFNDFSGRNKVYVAFDENGKITDQIGIEQFSEDSIDLLQNDTLQHDTIQLYLLLAEIPRTQVHANIIELDPKNQVIRSHPQVTGDSLIARTIPISTSLSTLRIISEQYNKTNNKRKVLVSDYKVK